MSEPIQLWKCARCIAPYYDERMKKGDGCMLCGSMKVSRAPANAFYITAYLVRHPGLIGKFIKENVLGWA